MSIREIGYLKYFGHDCVYIQDDMNLVLTPKNKNESILQYYFEPKDKLTFESIPHHYCVASIKEQIGGIDFHSITLSINYFAKLLFDDEISFFVMEGNEIDEFFSPLEYYFRQKKAEQYKSKDLLYQNEVVDSYSIQFENKNVRIDLMFGDVLTNGIRSDLSLHSKLKINIEKTRDLDYIFRLSNKIKMFLQFVHRKQNTNLKNLELFSVDGKKITNIGYMYGSLFDRNLRPHSKIDGSFIWYGDKLQELINNICSDKGFSTKHLYETYNNYYDYTTLRFAAICSSFEHEYKMDNIYEKRSSVYELPIKKKIIENIDSIETNNELENEFMNEAIKKINEIGSSVGLKQKILNVFEINKKAFESSYLDRFPINDDFIKDAAAEYPRLRGKALHDNMSYSFDDKELLYIRLVDMLQFIMVLRRSGFTQKEISILIGILFGCNSKFINEITNSKT